MKIVKRLMTVVSILFFLAVLGILPAAAQLPTCDELGTDPSFGLVGNPQLSAVSSETFTDDAYCQVDITVSSESGPETRYLPGQSE